MTDPDTPLWTPDPQRASNSRLAELLLRHGFDTYQQAWDWSVDPSTAGAFWREVADTFGVCWYAQSEGDLVPDRRSPTGARWFPAGRLNYAERCLRYPPGHADSPAVLARSQTRPDADLSWNELRSLVARARTGLLRAGVGVGDGVAGYLPNVPETLALMLASASLGAVWTCCAPEMGVGGCVERLQQVAPKVLVAVDGYRYGKREIDRTAEADEIRGSLASTTAVWLPYLSPAHASPPGWTSWSDFTAEEEPLEFQPVGFDHPLYVLFSSGTTGRPKAIVHGHGGILLEHAKALGWQFDLGGSDTFFWYAATGWMMWNFCVSGLLVDSTIVLYDGDPSGPEGDRLWELMASTGTTCGGVGAGYLVASMKNGLHPGRRHDLSSLRTLGSTGSPLPAAAATWAYREVGEDLMLASFSGGTDVCTGFVGPSPLSPVWPGEISCRCLGAKVEVHDDGGRPVVGDEGELVLSAPLPSMPIGILGDADGSRFGATYFPSGPGVWVHGDRATLTERGTVVITGRSDGTLNRGGVRMGTAEFYTVVEALPQVSDSLVVHVEDPNGGPGQLMLFVVALDGADPARLTEQVRAAIGQQLSPRHQPDVIEYIESVPKTLSGKKMEVPVKRILAGAEPAHTVDLDSVADPESLKVFAAMRPGGGAPVAS